MGELLKRVFLTGALVCDRCGGPRRLLTFVSDHDAIQKILLYLGLPTGGDAPIDADYPAHAAPDGDAAARRESQTDPPR